MSIPKCCLGLFILLFCMVWIQPASALVPYESYTYNYWGDPVASPAPYIPERIVDGASLGVGSMLEPSDLVTTKDHRIYLLDSGNHRIIQLDDSWKAVKIIDSFTRDGVKDSFLNPSGIYVDDAGLIYVADTDHGRVVVLDEDGIWVRTIENPESDILAADFKFVPLKITVDRASRVYVVARGVFEGIMQFDDQGHFLGYVGTNKVRRDVVDYIWRLISTKAQRSQMALYIPTEFSNVDIDHKGFVYATNIDPGSTEPVKRLNPSGADVLKRYGYFDVKGDINYRIFGANAGPSKLIDVAVQDGGMYSVLDSLRGRIFTYDEEGNLLYMFGGIGNQMGLFKTPVAIGQVNDRMIVLDRGKASVVVFKPTAFGREVQHAVQLHAEGNDTAAVESWKQVLRYNANYDIAYIGIGKSLLMEKNNEEALTYFELGMERKNYSVAYKRYRKSVMQEQFGTFLNVLVIVIAAIVIWVFWRKWKLRRIKPHEAEYL